MADEENDKPDETDTDTEVDTSTAADESTSTNEDVSTDDTPDEPEDQTAVFQSQIIELTDIVAERDATIAKMLTDHTAAIATLKAANYDLLTSGSTSAALEPVEDTDEPGDGSDPDENMTFDDMFSTGEDDDDDEDDDK